MSALCELIPYIVYLLLGMLSMGCLVLTFITKKSAKIWPLMVSVFFVFLIVRFNACEKEDQKKSQLEHVGIYYLTNYPNCEHCILVLNEDQTCQVTSNDSILEKSNWHFESGGDYWITYIGTDGRQLGSGIYTYKRYKLKYPGENN